MHCIFVKQTRVKLLKEQLLKFAVLRGVDGLVAQDDAIFVHDTRCNAVELRMNPQAAAAVAVLHLVPAAHAYSVGKTCCSENVMKRVDIHRHAILLNDSFDIRTAM